MVIPIRDENPTRRFPFVTVALIAVNCFVYFFVQMPKSDVQDLEFLYEYAAVPCEVTSGEPVVAVPVSPLGQPLAPAPTECAVGATGIQTPQPVFPDKNVYLAVLFSMFLHGSILHVLGNMLFLWIFGNNVEDRLGPIGFLLFYVVTGLAAAGAHIALNANDPTPVVGASGAIAGVMGAYIVWFPRARVLSILPILFFFTFVELPAVAVLGLWFVLQFFTSPDTGVAWLAHVGGFVAGAALAYALNVVLGPPRLGPPRPPPTWGRRSRHRDDPGDWGFRGPPRGGI